MLPVGATAPDFELPGRGRPHRRLPAVDAGRVPGPAGGAALLSRRRLAGVHAPADASTPRGSGAFEDLDAQVLALSHQSPESHLAFAERNGGFGFPMLADEDKAGGPGLRGAGPAGPVPALHVRGRRRRRHRLLAPLRRAPAVPQNGVGALLGDAEEAGAGHRAHAPVQAERRQQPGDRAEDPAGVAAPCPSGCRWPGRRRCRSAAG